MGILVMGIINITDDSYYSPSRALDIRSFEKRAEQLIKQGADILDIGACSSRPGSSYISVEQEWERLSVILPAIDNYTGTAISIDTFRSDIVKRIYDKIGRFIVNDISSGEDDPQMLSVVGELGLEYIAMHKRGTPDIMQQNCSYENISEEIISYFKDFETKASKYGISDYILDPGFGFSKTTEQNFRLLSDLDKLKPFGKKILVGISRKSMIYKALNSKPEEVLHATSALHLFSLLKGADILRVHDVKEAKEIITLFSYLCQA